MAPASKSSSSAEQLRPGTEVGINLRGTYSRRPGKGTGKLVPACSFNPPPALRSPLRVTQGDGWGVFPHLINRAKPGLIAVLPNGRCFVNEPNLHHDVIQALFASLGPGQAARAFLVVDQPFLRRFALGFVKPFPVPVGPNIRSGYLENGNTVAELARNAGIDPAGLETTVPEWNPDMEHGEDRAFGKGAAFHHRWREAAPVPSAASRPGGRCPPCKERSGEQHGPVEPGAIRRRHAGGALLQLVAVRHPVIEGPSGKPALPRGPAPRPGRPARLPAGAAVDGAPGFG